jgi:hypothetical protein
MANRRVDPDVDRLWQQFHDHVNVESPQLRDFLFADVADEDGALSDVPERALPEPGRHILAVLGKRKVDLTDDDIDLMDDVVVQIRELLDRRPPQGATDEQWRRALLRLGHDALREPPSGDE